MKGLAIVAAALAVGVWSQAAETRPEEGTAAPEMEATEVQTSQAPEGQTAWVERRIRVLREDIGRFEKRLESSAGDEKGRESNRGKLAALKERLTKLEDRFKADKTDEQAYAVEEEVYVIEDDLNHLRRDSKTGAREMKTERR